RAGGDHGRAGDPGDHRSRDRAYRRGGRRGRRFARELRDAAAALRGQDAVPRMARRALPGPREPRHGPDPGHARGTRQRPALRQPAARRGPLRRAHRAALLGRLPAPRSAAARYAPASYRSLRLPDRSRRPARAVLAAPERSGRFPDLLGFAEAARAGLAPTAVASPPGTVNPRRSNWSKTCSNRRTRTRRARGDALELAPRRRRIRRETGTHG